MRQPVLHPRLKKAYSEDSKSVPESNKKRSITHDQRLSHSLLLLWFGGEQHPRAHGEACLLALTRFGDLARYDLDHDLVDIRSHAQEARAMLHEGVGNGAVEVGFATLLAGEGVEDIVHRWGGVFQFHRVPLQCLGLRLDEAIAAKEEFSHSVSLSFLGDEGHEASASGCFEMIHQFYNELILTLVETHLLTL